jgi:hypothetical protein
MRREIFGRDDGDVKRCGNGGGDVKHIKVRKVKMNMPATG